MGDGAIVCSNTDKSILPIDVNGFVFSQCDQYGIQGSWYCYSDSPTGEGCTTGVVPFSTASPGPGMCLSGTLAKQSGYVGLGLELNATGGMMSTKNPFNATAAGITGFDVTITGSTGGAALRIGYTGPTQQTTPSDPAPFVSEALSNGASTTIPVLFSQAAVPATFMGDPGATVDATKVYDIQIELAGGTTSATYNFCVTSIKPITSGTVTNTCTPSAAICGAQATIPAGNYTLQNNMFNNMSGQCVALTCSGNNPGFVVTDPGGSYGNGGNTPSSYPSFIYGWQNGSFYGAYQTGKQLSAITGSVISNWTYTIGGGEYDAAYDIWFGSAATGSTPTTELMVWGGYSGSQPAGSQVGTVTINGQSWQVWVGTISSWKYIAYRLASGGNMNFSNFDLKPFFTDATSRNVNLSTASYLWGIQAGFEVYTASGSPATTLFNVSVP
jgi:hypothetical protein